VCIRAFGQYRPGDTTEVPDDAAVSGMFWAEPGSAEAVRAAADAAAATPPAAPAANDPPATPSPSTATTAPSSFPKAADLGPATEGGA
jgi:hypothetical protein